MSEIINSTYEIIGKIGSGGGGNVFLANHLRLGKKVILKADKRKLTTRPDLLRREVDVLKELHHPYIPQVYDFFVENETVYTVMDYIEGESLDRPLKRGERFSQPQVIWWGRELLEALCYLHSPTHGSPPRGYVHSDIKPANLMRTPSGDICLIDFNITLAIGEETVIGCSAGYASPEHYGLDFSVESTTVDYGAVLEGGDETRTVRQGVSSTVPAGEKSTVTLGTTSEKTVKKKIIVPDVRSDIYSVGATLYHLLSGKRPSKDARKVIKLSDKEFSPQIVRIITKAMEPNPDLRYQTADEMLNALTHLHENDIRMRRWKKRRIGAYICFPLLFLAGLGVSFIGLKRMQTTERWLRLAEYSENAFLQGDTQLAIDYAMQAFPEHRNIFTPQTVPEAQAALTKAVGVYDLSDGYKTDQTLALPSAPFFLEISPDGKTGAAVCQQKLVIFDIDSAGVLSELPAGDSALAEAEFSDDHTIIYAGANGLQCYDINEKQAVWSGEEATALDVSGDLQSVVSVYKEQSYANIYNVSSGEIADTVDFSGKSQQIAVNDNFANPQNNLLELNGDGSLLAVSFEDGSLEIYDLKNNDNVTTLLGSESGFNHFEGGFYNNYFAFSASSPERSVFAVIDVDTMTQTGGFESEKAFSVLTDENGIYVQTENILVQIDPVTGDQTPRVTTTENITGFDVSGDYTVIASDEGISYFNNGTIVTRFDQIQQNDFLQISGNAALIGSMDAPYIRIMKYENHPEAEVLTYDPSYEHDEARISGDGKTVMLFSYDQFRIYSAQGDLIQEVVIPDPQQVYDQQYIRDGENSVLEVLYYDGTKHVYNAEDGILIRQEQGEAPDEEMYEIFSTDKLRFESPLHGAVTVYDIESGKKVGELEEDAYLTYITQAENYIIAQYVTADGYCYGQMMNEKCEVLAHLPYLTDIVGMKLYFDYPTGNIRHTHIYNIDDLIESGRSQISGIG
ncbi:serine/threonine protein kinase/WD40 repeat protein [Catenibacillus scindens]|uniref:non-specific serine/threonine protein kinase n=1 Tax=Catenibacillus scindens TaxID=673271 RepID=A0A7W8HAK2_9FIRM|nr:WD40 repeat domain-containing serine/threonine protein kinase [Catenibacillus scindens]MBB5264720.1 serine/threonine protein kinase/WD40 repeat protein [Catenibacillus scindens]